MQLKQFAFYTPGTSEKRDNTFLRRSTNEKQYLEQRNNVIELSTSEECIRQAIQELEETKPMTQLELESIERRKEYEQGTAMANGWSSPWAIDTEGSKADFRPLSAMATTLTATSSSPISNVGAGKWGRQAYYNAEKASASGVVFLNNKGGSGSQGSGVWDSTWGNSLSYASADGKSAASSPQILANTLLPDMNEFAIFTSKPCNDNFTSSCGFYRPGAVAYHGFDGPSKLFFLEFTMPLSGIRGPQQADTPAAWILNAEIPRVAQYNSCSCWASGCGEFDIYEPLDSGNTKCKSTFHSAQRSGGSSDWFARPTEKPFKIAVWFDAPTSQAVISRLPDDVDFADVVEDSKLASWLARIDVAKRRTFELPK